MVLKITQTMILVAIFFSVLFSHSQQTEKIEKMSAHIETLEAIVAGIQTMTCQEFITPTKRPKSWLIKK